MLRICICDDDETIVDRVSDLIYSILYNDQVDIFYLSSGESFLFHFLEALYDVDIVFMDISMKGLNGIETMKKMRNAGYKGELIYLTDFSDYVFDSFDTYPLNYILKSKIDMNKFRSSLVTAANNATQKKKQMLIIGSDKKAFKAEKHNILYIESSQKKLIFHFKQSNPISTTGTLTQVIAIVGQTGFVQIHKSYVVNLENVLRLNANSVILADQTKLPIGRKYTQKVRQSFSAFLTRNIIGGLAVT